MGDFLDRPILCAVDDGESARAAARVAAELALRLERPLRLLHAMPGKPPLMELASARRVPPPHAERRKAAERQACELPEDLGLEVDAPGLELVVARGRPAEAILAAATQYDVELIVLGTHNRAAVAEMVLGSVSSQVIRRADRPVVITPGADIPSLRGRAIVAALDGTPLADAVLSAAAVLARRTAAPLVVAHVVERPRRPAALTMAGSVPLETAGGEEDLPRAAALTRAEACLAGGIDVEFVQRSGEPPEELLAVASDRDAAVIAVGARRFGPLRAGLLGSVSRALLASETVAVLVVTGKTRFGLGGA